MNVRLGNQSDWHGLGNKVGKFLGWTGKPVREGNQSDRPGLGNRLGWPRGTGLGERGNQPGKIHGSLKKVTAEVQSFKEGRKSSSSSLKDQQHMLTSLAAGKNQNVVVLQT